MDKLIIEGPNKLSGSVKISRAKNAYLPILAAVLLNDKPVHLKNLPELRDIRTMLTLLQNLGVRVDQKENVTTLDPSNISNHLATYELVKTMRASIFVLGPLLARIGKARVSLPGGCAIGTRPIDIHLDNLEKMGAEIVIENGYVEATKRNLKAVHLPLKFPSVGATENLMMAAVFTPGTTVIENSAREPEIVDLANFINAMGGKVVGAGTSKIEITGVNELKEVEYEAIGDRIEAATYVMAGLMTNSEITVEGIKPQHLEFVLDTLRSMGANLEDGENSIHVKPSQLKPAKIETQPYPGFPTDIQAQMMALCCTIPGHSIITEAIFENRFMHVPELSRLGAKIDLKGNSAFIEGSEQLSGAPVMCTDLRASAALVVAAVAAKGKSEIRRIYHLDRGYERLDQKLAGLGVKVQRVNENM
ncbi:MAG: UDP-N-acetylglucosamine 1-carboxyvinyltransferase [Bacteriovoracaceae bacterium]|nr:UDP-N-acetylglucosamine 1-carboxyvinyltransferase [Bacteriovoracaceae bacterium]